MNSSTESLHLLRLHVVGYIDGIQLIRKKTVPQVHPLLFSSRIDWNNSRVDDDDHSDNQMMFLQHGVGDEWNQVQSLVLVAVQFDDDDEKVRPGENSAGNEMKRFLQLPVKRSATLTCQGFSAYHSAIFL